MCRRLEEETCLKLVDIITKAIRQHNLRSTHPAVGRASHEVPVI